MIAGRRHRTFGQRLVDAGDDHGPSLSDWRTLMNDSYRNAKTFDTQGYLLVRSLFSQTQIAELKAIVERIYRAWLAENRALMIANRLVNMYGLTDTRYFLGEPEQRLALFDWIAQPCLALWLESLFGDTLYFHNTQLFFNPHDPGQAPYWHRDLQYSDVDDSTQRAEQGRLLALHVRVPLIAERGVALVPGSHCRWDSELERNVRFETNGYRQGDDLPGSLLIGLEPGDALLFDAQMLHRGHYRDNAERLAFDICIGRYHPATASFLDAAVLPSETEMARLVDDRWYRRAWRVAAGMD